MLTIINGILKVTRPSENGLLLFVGVDRNDCEIKEVLSPLNPVTEFFYHCGKDFFAERFEDLFVKKATGSVTLIDGNICVIYLYNGHWKKVKSMNANLIKRHKKGGQSQHRFERLAEISRADYITYVVDNVNHYLSTDSSNRNYLYGSRELKSMLLERKDLQVQFKTDDIYHTFDERTIQEPYFRDLMSRKVFDQDVKVAEVVDLISRGEVDFLAFTLNESQLHELEYIINVHSDPSITGPKVINLPSDHKYFSILKDYQIIGKLYVKNYE